VERERDLVQRLASATDRPGAIRALAGGLGATELRRATVSDRALDALREGLDDPNPRIRWWCIQVLDHVPDARALPALAEKLDDPIARVRRNAAHALGCLACKPAWDGALSTSVLQRLADMAAGDPNAKVRAEARRALACRPPGEP
jgi:HEAT repeat protein